MEGETLTTYSVANVKSARVNSSGKNFTGSVCHALNLKQCNTHFNV